MLFIGVINNMRPIRLRISAFGPFAKVEEIDFTKLGTNPLFLINGPTGSGKSTILDAICFALYGETTGNEREAKQMRSDHADAETLTEVTLEFELAKTRYRIKRIPDQLRPKARGEGTTEQKAKAELVVVEDKKDRLLVSPKITEATDKIIELTGLSAEQFRQVMVLPQGKFRDLLLAKSEDRESIFQHIFQTHIYTELQNKLRDKANLLISQIKAAEIENSALLGAQELESAESLAKELMSLKIDLNRLINEKNKSEEAVKQAQQKLQKATVLEQAFIEQQAVKLQWFQIESRQAEIAEEKLVLENSKSANAIESLYQQTKKQSKVLEVTKHQVLNAEKIQKQANNLLMVLEVEKKYLPEQEKSLETLNATILELNGFRERSLQLGLAKKNSLNTKQNLSNSKKQLDNKKKELLCQQERLKQQEEILKKTNDYLSTLSEKMNELEKLEDRGEKIRKITDLKNELNDARGILSHIKIKEGKAKYIYQQTSREQEIYEQSWVSGQSVILAAALGENEACPVCGSLHHPDVAVSHESLPTEKEVAKVRLHVKQKAEELESITRERLLKEEEIKSVTAKLNEEESNLSDAADFDLTEIRSRSKLLFTEINKLKKLKNTLPDLRLEMEVSQQKIGSVESGIAICVEKLTESHGLHSASENEVKNKEDELPVLYRDPVTLENKIAGSTVEQKSIKKHIAGFNVRYQQARESGVAAQAELMSLAKIQEEAQALLSKTIEDWVVSLKRSPFHNESDFLGALLTQEKMNRYAKSIREYEDEKLLLKKRLDDSNASIADKVRPDIAELIAYEKKLVSEKNKNDAGFHQAQQRQQSLTVTQNKVEQLVRTQTQLAQEYGLVGKLSDVSNGKNPHTLSLQRFVLSVLLDDVLTEASQRLLKMSKGRYQLYRKETVADKRVKAGLDLVVEDAYTGKQRAAATLSGGESFMAALALALGLSDVVQAYAGGIKLDTLFIDEGFGSLDPESLELAMSTLIDLRDSGRMVGIISHVDELKRMINVRLDVLVGKEVSMTRMVGV